MTQLRRLLLLAMDASLIALSFCGALLLRVTDLSSPLVSNQWHLLPWAILIGIVVLVSSGWYQGITRYSGSHSLYGMAPRTGLAVLLTLLVSTLSGGIAAPPRSFWIIFWIIYTASMISSRIVLRDLLRLGMSAPQSCSKPSVKFNHTGGVFKPTIKSLSTGVPTLIYGAGDAGADLLLSLRNRAEFRLLGFLDNDPTRVGRRLGTQPIYHPDKLPHLIKTFGIRQVLLATPRASRARKSLIFQQLTRAGLEVLIMPSLAELATGEKHVDDLRSVAVEDLLGRDPVPSDPRLLRGAVAGKAVLVTGAGGSIGSELCQQIVALGASCLVLLERNEYALYAIDKKLSSVAQANGVQLMSKLGDVMDTATIEQLFCEQSIQTLFHAAAYKHVPLVEANPCSGVANNVLGTHYLLQAALRWKVERFLLISTDKAVRPISVMGASKRVCEVLVQEAALCEKGGEHKTICSMVRFGNVLGSSGSVVPLFRQQIVSGGPVLVTHPDITRYFMTIPEACSLVLQATSMAKGGEVFVLDMGTPVKIADLARQMIRLSGCSVRDSSNPEGDIAIEYTGLRPGEKLHEELLISANDEPTIHPLIRCARDEQISSNKVSYAMDLLTQALKQFNEEKVKQILGTLVPSLIARRSGCSASINPTSNSLSKRCN